MSINCHVYSVKQILQMIWESPLQDWEGYHISSDLDSSKRHKSRKVDTSFEGNGLCEILVANQQCKPDNGAVTMKLLIELPKLEQSQYSEYNL